MSWGFVTDNREYACAGRCGQYIWAHATTALCHWCAIHKKLLLDVCEDKESLASMVDALITTHKLSGENINGLLNHIHEHEKKKCAPLDFEFVNAAKSLAYIDKIHQKQKQRDISALTYGYGGCSTGGSHF